jgi:hypothetical protein
MPDLNDFAETKECQLHLYPCWQDWHSASLTGWAIANSLKDRTLAKLSKSHRVKKVLGDRAITTDLARKLMWWQTFRLLHRNLLPRLVRKDRFVSSRHIVK